MGDIIGGIIGGVGSLVGANQAQQADKHAAEQALTGYNYLTQGPGAQYANSYLNAGQNAIGQQGGVQNMEAQLLGAAPMGQGTNDAFNNYLNSTGYQFQMDQGQKAITGSNAAKGILNSGATAKALTSYGQGLGSQYFNNYLTQLGGLNNQYGATANAGQNMLGTIGQAGTAGGGNAGKFTQAGGEAMGNGIAGAFGSAGQLVQNNVPNRFGGFG